MNTTLQGKPTRIDWLTLGKDSGGAYYTVVYGTPVFVGTDGASVARRVIPVSNISDQICVGVSLSKTADVQNYTKGKIAIAIFPFVVVTDHVDASAPPEVGKDVYIDDDGEYSDTDGGSSSTRYGHCLDIDGTDYLLNMTGPDVDTTS